MKLYSFCLGIVYLARRHHPYIEILPTLMIAAHLTVSWSENQLCCWYSILTVGSCGKVSGICVNALTTCLFRPLSARQRKLQEVGIVLPCWKRFHLTGDAQYHTKIIDTNIETVWILGSTQFCSCEWHGIICSLGGRKESCKWGQRASLSSIVKYFGTAP